jgi:hypothetical protein
VLTKVVFLTTIGPEYEAGMTRHMFLKSLK